MSEIKILELPTERLFRFDINDTTRRELIDGLKIALLDDKIPILNDLLGVLQKVDDGKVKA